MLELTNLPSNWEREPENKDELECVVEWEPVYGADGALKNGQESKDDPVLQEPVSVEAAAIGQINIL
jgi:hypothetical protein